MSNYKVGDRVQLYSVHYKSKTGVIDGIQTGYVRTEGDIRSFQILEILGEKGDRYTLPETWVSKL